MAKKDKTKKTVEKNSPVENTETETTSSPKKNEPMTKSQYAMLGAAALLVIAGLLFYFKGLFIAATVNGQPISRFAVISELEKQSGQKALDTMVTKKLIMQEADRKHVTVNQKELDEEAKKIEQSIQAQGQSLDQVLKMQGMTRENFNEEVRLQKLLEKMVGDVKVTDAEVEKFMSQNQQMTSENTNPDEMKKSLKESLKQEKMTQKIQTLIAELKKKAKINYFVKY